MDLPDEQQIGNWIVVIAAGREGVPRRCRQGGRWEGTLRRGKRERKRERESNGLPFHTCINHRI
jgi:hypothetical protein